ncbi:MAG: GIY-YIG nuclease family protein [Candidatus Zhuqueibacterota bacterium]
MGYIYVLSNPSMPGLVKIGCTDRAPDERIAELSNSTGVPTPFNLEFAVFLRDHSEAEKEIHQTLVAHRVSGSREFFRVSVESAKEALLDQLQVQMVSDIDGWDDRAVVQMVETILNKRPRVRQAIRPTLTVKLPAVEKAAILSWNDEKLMELVDAIFSARPVVRREFK